MKCSLYDLNENKSNATVTYTFIGLNEKGNELNRDHIQDMYKHNADDWVEAINNFKKQ